MRYEVPIPARRLTFLTTYFQSKAVLEKNVVYATIVNTHAVSPRVKCKLEHKRSESYKYLTSG
jgi:hypothetical protein